MHRLNLADATSNEEIEQQLADPWSGDRVAHAFQETLASWKARTKPKRMTGTFEVKQLTICSTGCTHLHQRVM